MPVTSFDYYEKESGWIDDTVNWPNFSPFDRNSSGEYLTNSFLDFNGDSWVDNKKNVHDSDDWVSSNWAFPQYWSNNSYSDIPFEKIIWAELNGDKYPDIVSEERDPNSGIRFNNVYLNNKENGFSYSQSWSDEIENTVVDPGYFEAEKFLLSDVNADGLDDIVFSYHNLETDNSYNQVYLNIGDGFEGGYGDFPGLLAKCDTAINSCNRMGTQLIDVNGDGLLDVFSASNYLTYDVGIFLNNGEGWETSSSTAYIMPDEVFVGQWKHGVSRFTDVNGDGLVDIEVAIYDNYEEATTTAAYLNDGDSWVETAGWEVPKIFVEYNSDTELWWDQGARMMDLNNDGSIDLVKSFCDYNGTDCATERAVHLGTTTYANLLSEIDNGYGSTTTINYKSSGTYFDSSGDFQNPLLPISLATVEEITIFDGIDNEVTTNYEYKDGIYYYDDDYTLNQYAGFGVVNAQTGDQIVKTYYHQGGGVDGYELGEYEDTIYKKGRVYREEVLEEDGANLYIISSKVNKWLDDDLEDGRHFVSLDNSVSYVYEEDVLVTRSDTGRSLPQGSNQKLVDLLEDQAFAPKTQPQLNEEISNDFAKHYFLGLDSSGNARYEARFYDEESIDPFIGDGELYRHEDPCSDWDGIVDAANATSLDSGPEVDLEQYQNGSCTLSRIFLPFNTESLPDTATVTSAILSIEASYVGAQDVLSLVNVDTDNGELTDGKYGLVEDIATDTAYFQPYYTGRYDFEFDETGLSWINLTATTTLALRGQYDMGTGGGPGVGTDITFYTVEQEGTENDPYLLVEYTLNEASVASDLEVEGSTNPDDVEDQTPEFTAVYNDPNEGDLAEYYQIQVIGVDGNYATSTVWDSTKTSLASTTPVGYEIDPISYGGTALPLDGMQYYWRIKFWDDGEAPTDEGYWSSGYDYFYMDGTVAPDASEGLWAENKVEPIDIINLTPSFSAIFYDDNPLDKAKWYEIEVDNNIEFTSTEWDTGKTLLSELLDNGSRSSDFVYDGSALSYDGDEYNWRIRFWDAEDPSGTQGVWATSTFSMFNESNTLTTASSSARTYDYDSVGNLIEQFEYGHVKAAENGVYVDVTGDSRDTDYLYANNDTDYIKSAIKKRTVTDNSGPNDTEQEIYYDDLAYGQISNGNLTKEDLVLGDVEYKYSFNDYGLVMEKADPLRNITLISYDTDYYYPTSTVNDLGQTYLTEYDLKTGNILSSEDLNGLVEEKTYDEFGRLTKVERTDPVSTTTMVILEQYTYYDTADPFKVKKEIKVDATNWIDTYTYFDGLGRVIQTREEWEDSDYIVTSMKYDEEGNLVRQSIPYLDNGTSYTTPTWTLSTQPYTSYIYDTAGRVLTEQFNSSTDTFTTTYEYDKRTILITDPENNKRKLFKDAYGNLIKVDEYNDTSIYSTLYNYNYLNKLSKITDSLGNTRKFSYDDLGRLLYQEEMHYATSTSFGTWDYEYDDASNLTEKEDPEGNIVQYTYDDLNRVLTENFTGLAGTEIGYTYDTNDYSIGRLSKVIFDGIEASDSKQYEYDIWGRVNEEHGYIDRHSYNMDYKYT
ncbi:hypothetical protein HOG11_00090, partial [bacterium]|nr:hypothetical protein [bacterium]